MRNAGRQADVIGTH
jgi:hypothetical protein